METFKVSTDSWHYKFLTKTGDSRYDIKYGCKDFCSYWRKVFFRGVVTLVVVALATILTGLYLNGLVFHTSNTLIGTGIVLGVIASGIATLVIIDLLQDKMRERARENEGKPAGLIKTKYRSFKDKYCPMVEIVEND